MCVYELEAIIPHFPTRWALSPDGVEDLYPHYPPYGYECGRKRHHKQDKSHARCIRGLGEEIGWAKRKLEGMGAHVVLEPIRFCTFCHEPVIRKLSSML
jgi:hypothetical protein